MPGPEKKIEDKIRKWLDAVPNCWHYKKAAGPFGKTGLPDIMGICRGLAFGLEVKVPGNEATKLQAQTLAEMRAAGCRVAAVVHSVEEAMDAMEPILGYVREQGSVTWIANEPVASTRFATAFSQAVLGRLNEVPWRGHRAGSILVTGIRTMPHGGRHRTTMTYSVRRPRDAHWSMVYETADFGQAFLNAGGREMQEQELA